MSIEKFLLPRVLKLIYDKDHSCVSTGFDLIYDRFKGFNYKEAYIDNFPATGLSLLCLYNLLKEDKIIIGLVVHESYSVVKIYTLPKKSIDKISDSYHCCKVKAFPPEFQIALNDLLFKGGDS